MVAERTSTRHQRIRLSASSSSPLALRRAFARVPERASLLPFTSGQSRSAQHPGAVSRGERNEIWNIVNSSETYPPTLLVKRQTGSAALHSRVTGSNVSWPYRGFSSLVSQTSSRFVSYFGAVFQFRKLMSN